jgi:hypothetical protein
MTVFLWSTTAANNDDIDGTINWQEGQSPASVNNSARAMMAAIAKWRGDLSGNLVTAGSSTAYTLTTNQVFTSLTDGLMVAARMDEVNGASPTLNVDSLGAKSIATVYGTAVGAGKLRAGGVYTFVYDLTDDKWIVHGNPNDGFEAGTKILFRQTAAPVGWTKDTTYTDAALRVTSGTISQQSTSGKEFSTLFAARTISTANLPSHSHTFSGTTSGQSVDHAHTLPFGLSTGGGENGSNSGSVGSGSELTTGTSSDHTHTYSGTTSSVGSGTAMSFDVNFVDCIIATRD